MKIVGINGSPRKNGNTHFLLKKALDASKIKNNKIINLVDYEILPCTACGKCWDTKKCPIDDDLEKIIKELVNSDAIILGSPVYYGTVTPEMKAFIDRSGELLGARGHPLKNKIGGALTVARRWGHLTTWTVLLFYLLEMRLIIPGAGWSSATGMKPDQVETDEEGVERAVELGEAIGDLCRKLGKK